MRHRKPPRYRVMAKGKDGALWAHDRGTMMAAIREARSMLASKEGWSDICIRDTHAGVLWTLMRWEEPKP
jgi:hypothetical protein